MTVLRWMVALGLPLALISCSRRPTPESAAETTRQFVYESLALQPVYATAAGDHTHSGAALDGIWNDPSPEGIAKLRAFYERFGKLTDPAKTAQLSPGDRADFEIIHTQAKLAALEFDVLQAYRHNPTTYVETIGNGLFTLYSVESSPAEARFGHIISRLNALPKYAAAARANLVDSPPIWAKVALEENSGNVELVDVTLRKACPAALRAAYDQAAGPALDALRALSAAITALPSAGEDAWRLGADKYAKKFALVMGSTATPDQLLDQAEAALKTVRRRMFDLSLPLHKKMYPTHRDPVDLNLIVGETLNRLAIDHVPANRYFQEAQATLEEARAFLKAHPEITLPSADVLKLIETPVFMRGVYGVGGFNPAPILEPAQGAFYWLTPIGDDWPADRKESKLREYNRYGLRILTLHEAIPGHYLQSEWANRVQPEPRRVLRGQYGSGVNVEGWAVYASEQALNLGYLDQSPEMRLTFLKQQLRAIANTILDIRMQTRNMTDQEALDLMQKQTFQEREEAVAKLQRAKLDSCQLPTYFAGYREWVNLRNQTRLSPAEFHKRALSEGPLPMSTLGALLAAESVR